ncbi:hypothetical protein [Mycobacterium paragordonae]|uniref:hypothetical protein n=1 Tax=Mycobacterium paragordonae TaxID=1389713 RepID=UPI00197D7D30|nr:hypothetical protein [Mycobacterium paragordonae]
MPDDIIARAEAALEGVTDGPWVAEYSGEQGNCVIPHDAQSTREAVCTTHLYYQVADAEFIAAARTLVPALAAELEAARAEAAQWKSLWQQNTENAAEAMRERDEARAEVERLKSRPIANIELSDEEAANVIRNTAEALQEARAEVERLQAGQAVRCNYPTCKADW